MENFFTPLWIKKEFLDYSLRAVVCCNTTTIYLNKCYILAKYSKLKNIYMRKFCLENVEFPSFKGLLLVLTDI